MSSYETNIKRDLFGIIQDLRITANVSYPAAHKRPGQRSFKALYGTVTEVKRSDIACCGIIYWRWLEIDGHGFYNTTGAAKDGRAPCRTGVLGPWAVIQFSRPLHYHWLLFKEFTVKERQMSLTASLATRPGVMQFVKAGDSEQRWTRKKWGDHGGLARKKDMIFWSLFHHPRLRGLALVTSKAWGHITVSEWVLIEHSSPTSACVPQGSAVLRGWGWEVLGGR